MHLLQHGIQRCTTILQGLVFHLAGLTRGRTHADFRAGNVIPTANILSTLAERDDRPARVIIVSSQAAAGPASSDSEPVTEHDAPHPVERYGQSKLDAEQAAARFSQALPIVVVRPSAVYGPRARDFLAAFAQAAARIAVFATPRDHRMSIVHVRDLVRALILAAEQPAAIGRTYFVANTDSVSWGELYATIAAVARSSPLQVQLPRAVLEGAAALGDLYALASGRTPLLTRNKVALASPRWWLCDASRIGAELGWKASVPLQDGVRETYLWYLAQGWLGGRSLAASTGPAEERSE